MTKNHFKNADKIIASSLSDIFGAFLDVFKISTFQRVMNKRWKRFSVFLACDLPFGICNSKLMTIIGFINRIFFLESGK